MDLQKNEVIMALNNNNFKEALTKAKELETLYPDNPEVKTLMGDIFVQMGNFLMAAEQYERAMKIDPLNAVTYSKLGFAHAGLNKWEQAVSYFNSALNLEPENYRFYGSYGWALWTYGRIQNNQSMMKEAFGYLMDAKQNGIEMQIVNDALAEYHIANTTASWPVVQEENGPASYATKLEHVTEAKRELRKAAALMSDSNEALREEFNATQDFIKDLEKRAFHGYPFVRKGAITIGIILLLIGSFTLGITVLIMAALYHHSQLSPGYIANRRYLKGNYGEPFWVRRINEIGNFASNISFYSTSFTKVLLMGWLFRIFTVGFQYMMAVFFMPFLIISGYITNYDLLNQMKQLTTEKVANA